MKISEEPVKVICEFLKNRPLVWDVITSPDHMCNWFFENIPDFKPEVGFKTEFDVNSGERVFRHLWEVTEIIHEEKITYNWKYDAYPGDSFVSFSLTDSPKGSILVLETKVVEDFPDEVPEFRRESCEAGWQYFLKDQLKNYLDTL